MMLHSGTSSAGTYERDRSAIHPYNLPGLSSTLPPDPGESQSHFEEEESGCEMPCLEGKSLRSCLLQGGHVTYKVLRNELSGLHMLHSGTSSAGTFERVVLSVEC